MVNQILYNTSRDMDSTGLVVGLTHTEIPVPLPLPLQMPLASKLSDDEEEEEEESANGDITFQRASFHPKPQSSSPVSKDEVDDELSDDDDDDDDDDDWENDSLLLDSLEQLGEDHFYGAGMPNGILVRQPRDRC